ncbi:type II toxin-antitoxin system RelE/ParE family toxin [Octadecabacter ascidiaceicola]|uniref:Plasmid stabilization system protein n=1 Tax=Octadecabacter ascidiaceicola TaxID=1655543 RepID=A0A238KSE9_9RHOB|nr:Plasmid stabilization system protein [Octadecabacter ascidiaceicola]
MPHKVVFGQQALNKLKNINVYLVERSPNGAQNVPRDIERAAELLGHFPMMGAQIELTSARFHITRKYKYRIVYRVSGERVEILNVYHPSQSR